MFSTILGKILTATERRHAQILLDEGYSITPIRRGSTRTADVNVNGLGQVELKALIGKARCRSRSIYTKEFSTELVEEGRPVAKHLDRCTREWDAGIRNRVWHKDD